MVLSKKGTNGWPKPLTVHPTPRRRSLDPALSFQKNGTNDLKHTIVPQEAVHRGQNMWFHRIFWIRDCSPASWWSAGYIYTQVILTIYLLLLEPNSINRLAIRSAFYFCLCLFTPPTAYLSRQPTFNSISSWAFGFHQRQSLFSGAEVELGVGPVG